MSHQTRAAAVIAVLFAFRAGTAQAARQSLRPATENIGAEFVQIAGIRELSDGRAIVSDFRAHRLVVVDFRLGTVTQIGREGSGPGEYPSTSTLHPLGGDTTIVTVPTLRRWLLLDGAGIVATLPADHPAVAAVGGTRGASRAGDLATTAFAMPGAGTKAFGADDSLFVIVTNFFRPERIDTVAKVRHPVQERVTWAVPGMLQSMSFLSQPAFETSEEILMFPDGWLAVARLDPYRVDWRIPGGPFVIGPRVAEPPTPVTEAEKRYYWSLNASAMRAPPMKLPDGTPPEIQKRYEAGRQRRWNEFPATIPPYQFPALMAAPKGLLVVERTRTAATPYFRYDFFDHSGRVVSRLSVAANQRIVGFGARSAFVVTLDDDGIERLSRHPWP